MSQDIWHTRLPLKIQIFLWYFKRGVLLTKDNLSRRNWRGDKNCVFCSNTETIHHLFFDCPYAKFLWRMCHIALGIDPPLGTSNLFGTWSQNGGQGNLLLFGAAGFCWALWLSRNDVIFKKTRPKSFLQVLFKGTHWLRLWAKLQRSEERTQMIVEGCRRIETVALHVFASFGWPYTARISF